MIMNQGIMHLSFQARGGRTACNMRFAHMSTTVERFRLKPVQCKRCAATLAKMDERKTNRTCR